jgi:hypothetical protein
MIGVDLFRFAFVHPCKGQHGAGDLGRTRLKPIDAFIQDAGRLRHRDVRQTIKASARRD